MAINCIRLAKGIGAKTICIDIGVRDTNFPDDKLEYVVKKYTEYCALAADFGARLGPENHWGCSRDPESLELLFDKMANVPNFGLQLHLGGWHNGNPEENDLLFIKYAMHLHIDFQHCYSLNDQHLANLRDSGYNGVWSIENHAGKNEYENVAAQLAHVKCVLKPNNYEVAPEKIHMLLERTVPGFMESIKLFVAGMTEKAASGKAPPSPRKPIRELPKE